MQLREYQKQGVETLRQGFREGHIRQLLCAPTGSGKTVMAAHLLAEVARKGHTAIFVCDLVSLVNQTSERLFEYGVEHGVVQGSNSQRSNFPILVYSAQTMERRGFPTFLTPKLVINDEAHTKRKAVIDLLMSTNCRAIGLSATPFTKGLGRIYSRCVNLVSTRALVEQGWLVPIEAYAAREIDMRGAKTNNLGEWGASEVERRAGRIIGNIVETWEEKTKLRFGGPVKTLVFAATVAHGEKLCQEFHAKGYDFQQVSYRDHSDETRSAKIAAFRRGDIMGLVSCEALAKGFDVADVLCGISARPYRKALQAHIQQLGRVMRPSPGKEFALWICHSGNFLGFHDEMLDFFSVGVDSLNDDEQYSSVRKSSQVKADLKCQRCGYVLQPGLSTCPACGLEKARPRSDFQVVPGEVDMVGASESRAWIRDKAFVWQHIQRIATLRRPDDFDRARKFALAQYKNWFGVWPKTQFQVDPEAPDRRVEAKVRRHLLRYWKSSQKATVS